MEGQAAVELVIFHSLPLVITRSSNLRPRIRTVAGGMADELFNFHVRPNELAMPCLLAGMAERDGEERNAQVHADRPSDREGVCAVLGQGKKQLDGTSGRQGAAVDKPLCSGPRSHDSTIALAVLQLQTDPCCDRSGSMRMAKACPARTRRAARWAARPSSTKLPSARCPSASVCWDPGA